MNANGWAYLQLGVVVDEGSTDDDPSELESRGRESVELEGGRKEEAEVSSSGRVATGSTFLEQASYQCRINSQYSVG